MNKNTKSSILEKLDRLSEMLLDTGTQEQLDIVEDIAAFDLAYDNTDEELQNLKSENEKLKEKMALYEKAHGNVVFINNR
jgi:cell division protein FtsB